jgi:hypothetical protein
MFRTIEGFFETAKLTLRPRTSAPLDWEGARARARYDAGPIVPEQAAVAR